MKKLIFSLMFALFLVNALLVSVSAKDLTVNMYDGQGPLNNVRVMNYECLDSNCNALNIIFDEIVSSNTVTISYSVPSITPFGYATFLLASGYQTQQVAWTPTTDHAETTDVEFFQYASCMALIEDIDFDLNIDENEEVRVEVEVNSALPSPTSIPYGKPGDANLIQEFFSAETEVILNVRDDSNQIVHTETQTVYIEEGENQIVGFDWTPDYTQAGTYSVEAVSSVPDAKCSNSVLFTSSDPNTLNVDNVNQAPVMDVINDRTVNEGDTLSVALTATDADGDTLTYSIVGVGGIAGTAYTYSPGFSDSGTYSVTIQVDDGNGGTDSETITITVDDVVVTPSNNAPVLGSIGIQGVNEGATLTVALTATDADGDTLTYSVTSGVGSITGTTYTYIPGLDANHVNEVTSVTIQVSDGTDTDSEIITVTVTDVNRVPVLTAIGAQSVDEEDTLSFTISATDADTDTLTYSATGLPIDATFNTGTGAFSWTPGDDDVGNVDVTFSVSDGNGGTDSEVVTITVDEAGDYDDDDDDDSDGGVITVNGAKPRKTAQQTEVTPLIRLSGPLSSQKGNYILPIALGIAILLMLIALVLIRQRK